MFDLEFNDVLACVEQVRHPVAGIDIGNGRRIFGQLFADDGIFAETEEGLQAMIDALVAYCTETRRRINTSKCEHGDNMYSFVPTCVMRSARSSSMMM